MNPSLTIYRGRFALLWHELPVSPETDRQNSAESSSHWDLMLELENRELLTWRLPGLPIHELFRANSVIISKRLPNHRLIYLDYEGPISGNRGAVKRTFSGDYRCSAPTPPRLDQSINRGTAKPSPTTPADKASQAQVDLPDNPLLEQHLNLSTCLELMLRGRLGQSSFACILQTTVPDVGSECRIHVLE